MSRQNNNSERVDLLYFSATFVAWGVTIWSLWGRQPPTRLSGIFSQLTDESSPGCSSTLAYLSFKTWSRLITNDTDTPEDLLPVQSQI